MKNVGIALLFTAAVLSFSFEEKKPCITVSEIKVKAPYGTVKIKVPNFSRCVCG
ncbi:hypothetical protein [Niastella populi]|uniref:hypothetical protein n=1 Tax=Niastella populi TaxID=550983 RepID=UPI0013FE335D|nr:hypothetical protein [Niastella populi]